MHIAMIQKFLVSTMIGLSSFAISFAQEAIIPRPSPLAMVTMKFENEYLKITYSQPHKNGRDIFGGLVKFGEVWRTGANESTEITTTADLLIGTDTLKAGTYAIYTIPEAEKWTVIFNQELGQWGAYNYNKKLDALRVAVVSNTTENQTVFEPFTIKFFQKNDQGEIWFLWDKTKVALPFRILH
jgi:hypothetical protein